MNYENEVPRVPSSLRVRASYLVLAGVVIAATYFAVVYEKSHKITGMLSTIAGSYLQTSGQVLFIDNDPLGRITSVGTLECGSYPDRAEFRVVSSTNTLLNQKQLDLILDKDGSKGIRVVQLSEVCDEVASQDVNETGSLKLQVGE